MLTVCKNCVWYGDCSDTFDMCDDYMPIQNNDSDICDIDELIERGRNDFYEEWNRYLHEFEN